MQKPLIESLFGSKIKATLVHWLYVEAPPSETFSERALARAAKVPPGSIHNALTQLVKNQFLVRIQGKRGPEYRAPFEDVRLKGIFLFLRQDSEIVRALHRALRAFKPIEYACIFGSFARGETHAGSDIDVLVLQSSAEDEFDTRTALQAVAQKIGREVNPQFLATGEFIADLEKGESVARSILANARIDLKGEAPWQT